MKIVCAGCGKEMGEKPPLGDPSITHSICGECLPKVLKLACKPAVASPEFRQQTLDLLQSKVQEANCEGGNCCREANCPGYARGIHYAQDSTR